LLITVAIMGIAGDGENFARRAHIMINEAPRCHRCFSRTVPGRSELRKDGCEKRTFECPKCHVIETKIVTDPLESESLRRLTENVRPPV
jgi:hypothetical protein